MVPQGKILVRVGLLIRLGGSPQAAHYRVQGMVLVKPEGEEMDADKRQMRRLWHPVLATDNRPRRMRLARATGVPVEAPPRSQPIEMAQAHRHGDLSLGCFVKDHPARTLRVLVEPCPQQRFLNVT